MTENPTNGGIMSGYVRDRNEAEVFPGMTFQNSYGTCTVIGPSEKAATLWDVRLHDGRIHPMRPSTILAADPDNSGPLDPTQPCGYCRRCAIHDDPGGCLVVEDWWQETKAALNVMRDREAVAYWNIMQFPGLKVGSKHWQHLPIMDEILTERGIAHERGCRTEVYAFDGEKPVRLV